MLLIDILRTVDYGYPDEGTFGFLTFGDFNCYTVERPWVDNRAFVSCIPSGDYYLTRHVSPRFGDCAIIYGGTVSRYPDDRFQRSSILIHPANRSDDLQGCIGLGSSMGKLGGRVAVLNSRRTVGRFLDLIQQDVTYNLRIRYKS